MLFPEGSVQIDFPEFGCLDVRLRDCALVFLSLLGSDREFADHPLAMARLGPIYSVSPDRSSALLAGHDSLYFFSAKSVDLRRVATLDREGDSGFEFLELHSLPQGSLCFFEKGLVLVTYSGVVEWARSEMLWPWCFIGLHDGQLAFRDDSGELQLFSAATGQELNAV